jgi:hypothetical protein
MKNCKRCEMKGRWSVPEVNGEEHETPLSRHFASGPRFELSTFRTTITSVVAGTNFPDVMLCSLVGMDECLVGNC